MTPPRATATFTTRVASTQDAPAIAEIYNESITDRLAMFETEARTPQEIVGWLDRGFPFVVCENSAGEVVAWASAPPYGARPAYSGVGVFSIYVARASRGEGVGTTTLTALCEEATARGLWKLVSLIFPDNAASLALARSLGFRQVGIYRRHAMFDGVWRDVVIVERQLVEPENHATNESPPSVHRRG